MFQTFELLKLDVLASLRPQQLFVLFYICSLFMFNN